MHNVWTVQWIAGRKELLVAFLLFAAFAAHLTNRRRWALGAFLLALLAGEHAVAFPFMVVVWDFLKPRPFGPERAIERPYRDWTLYFAVLGVYVLGRHMALGGTPLPVEPYFHHPLAPGFATFVFLKSILFALALGCHAPFLDRPGFILFFRHPLLIGLGALLGLAYMVWLVQSGDRRRTCLAFLLLTAVAHGPFLPMTAAPIYMCTPLIYFSLAVGAALDGAISRRKPTAWRKAFHVFVAIGIGANVIGSAAMSYHPWLFRNFPYTDRILPVLCEMAKPYPTERKILLVDAPYHAMDIPLRLALLTGRAPRDVILVAPGTISSPTDTRIDRLGPRSFRLTARGVPYWQHPAERQVTFYPHGAARAGKVIDRGTYRITIEEMGPPQTDPGYRYFAPDPGVAVLRVDLPLSEPPPLMIRFDEKGQPSLVP